MMVCAFIFDIKRQMGGDLSIMRETAIASLKVPSRSALIIAGKDGCRKNRTVVSRSDAQLNSDRRYK